MEKIKLTSSELFLMRTNLPEGSHSSTSIDPVVAFSISLVTVSSPLLRLVCLDELLPSPMGWEIFKLEINVILVMLRQIG